MNYENELIEKGINNNTISFVRRIYETYDYDIFNSNKGSIQRNIKSSIVSKILFSLEIEVLPIPIIVNKDMQIIDGHHLFQARKKKNLPILYYVVPDADARTIRMINLPRTNWSTTDLVKSFLDSGSELIRMYAKTLITDAKIPSGLIPTFITGKSSMKPLPYLHRDLINEATGDWASFDELLNRVDIYSRYKKNIKANRFFYSELFNNPKYDCKTLADMLDNDTHRIATNKIRGIEDMQKQIEGLIKGGRRGK